jgi:sterol 14-demethylase
MQLSNLVDRALRRTPRPAGLKEPPRLSNGLPLVGHTVEFLTQPLKMLERAQKELGEIAGIQVAGKRIVAMFGPDAHEAVFRAPDELLNPQEAYAFMTPIFGKGLVYDAPVAKMNEQVKMLLPALKDRRMRTYGEAIVLEVERSLKEWQDEGVVDLVEYCRVLTNFTSSRCLLGAEFREGMTEEFSDIYHALERGITPIAYLNANLPLPAFRRRDKARVRLVELISRIIEARRKEGREGEDFLQTLMESKYADGRALDDDEITGMLLAAMFAGHHTSSVTTAWALIELLRNRRFLDRTVAEIDRVFGGGAPVDMKGLRELTFTEHVVKETLRLHPPLFMLIRVAQKDWAYKGYHVPKGSWIVVSPTVSHLIPEYFKRPEVFDPDRFAPPREEDKTDWAYIPFGGGRHKCLGNAFAILQIKTILAILLTRYEFDLYGDPIESDFQSMVIGPKEPSRLRYRRREARPVVAARPVAAEAPRPANGDGKAAASGCPFHAPAGDGAAAPAGDGETRAKKLVIRLDRDLCQGHAVCVGEAPEVFEVGEDHKVRLKLAEPPPELHKKVAQAARYCPTKTIQLVEE